MSDAGWSLGLPDPEATERLGASLAATRPTPAIVFLKGDLGAGKTTLARAMLRGLGVQGPVRSPTYTLIERYPLDQGEAVHMDLYRLSDPGELDFLGLDDLHAEAGLWLVEWPERGEGALPRCDLVLELGVDGIGRRARLLPLSGAGAEWVSAVKQKFS
jgi:tRNA threonylcarbamoyl adenosine modification protein YjeE